MEDEVYQAFMVGYVRRINAATLNVVIGGVRIGHAKYSRLAQINLRTRIITFSRYAVENVPERGRRYLVIHELAHVQQPGHNKPFWDLVGSFEPDYKQIDQQLQNAFQQNVRAQQRQEKKAGRAIAAVVRNQQLILPGQSGLQVVRVNDAVHERESAELSQDDCFDGTEDEFGAWSDPVSGIICGG